MSQAFKKSHAARVSNIESPTSKIFDALSPLLPEGGGKDADSLKAQQFHELIRRSITDASGHLSLASQANPRAKSPQARVTIGKNFEIIETFLHKVGIKEPEKIFSFFTDMVATYTKGIVQTPHPTEMLGKEAIIAEEKLVNLLEDKGRFLFKSNNPNLNTLNNTEQEELRENLATLFEAMKPIDKPLTVSDEMRRSVIFSERMFDSVPIVVNRILAPTGKTTHDLSVDDLAKFSHILKPMTWSPGDQDSKSQMTVAELEKGYRINRRAMFKHYAMKLVQLLDESPKLDKKSRAEVTEVIHNLFHSAQPYEEKREMREADFQDYVESAISRAAKWRDVTIGKQSGPDTISQKTVNAIAKYKSEAKTYDSVDDVLEAFAALRELPGGVNHVIKMTGNEGQNVGAIDALIIQAHNFGLTALQSQIRQNAEQHEEVFDYLKKLLPDDIQQELASHREGANAFIELLKDGTNAQAVREIIFKKISEITKNGLHKYKEHHQRLLEDVEKAKQTGDEKEIEKAQKRADELRPYYEDLESVAKEYDAQEGGTKHKEEFYFYQTMKTLEFASQHSDFIPQYLIAECGMREKFKEEGRSGGFLAAQGAEDMVTLLALLKTVQPSARERDDAKLPPVEVVPLVEHPEQVMADKDGDVPFVEMMQHVLRDKNFKEHQKEVSTEQYQHLLTQPVVKNGELIEDSLTGNDILAQVSASSQRVKDKPVLMAQRVMGAGSDVSKFGGAAASALMQNAMFKLKEALASDPDPVLILDYIGCGGGVHRTQPISNAMETVQGRSMRKTAEAVATKTTALLARNMRNRLPGIFERVLDYATRDMIPDRTVPGEERLVLAQLNLGNMANLPRKPANWDHYSKDIIQQATQNYIDFTRTDEYGAMLTYAARAFSKMTSYAARATDRVRAGAADVEKFPPTVEMNNIRAIGYGATLNASGSSAGLYVGMEALVEQDINELARNYKFDPLLQDAVNRATYGVAMADLDTAWKYVGRDKVPGETELKELDAKLGKSKELGLSDVEMAQVALAHTTLIHQQLGETLIQLHSSVSRRPAPSVNGPISERLLSVIPSALASQIQTSRDNIKQPREALAALFRQVMSNNGAPAVDHSANPHLSPKLAETISGITDKNLSRKDEQENLTVAYEKVVYPAMGAILECYEHAPRAYTSPHWAMMQSQENSVAI